MAILLGADCPPPGKPTGGRVCGTIWRQRKQLGALLREPPTGTANLDG